MGSEGAVSRTGGWGCAAGGQVAEVGHEPAGQPLVMGPRAPARCGDFHLSRGSSSLAEAWQLANAESHKWGLG